MNKLHSLRSVISNKADVHVRRTSKTSQHQHRRGWSQHIYCMNITWTFHHESYVTEATLPHHSFRQEGLCLRRLAAVAGEFHSAEERENESMSWNTSWMWWAWFTGHVPGLWDLFRVWFETIVRLWVIFILCHCTESLCNRHSSVLLKRHDRFMRWTDLTASTELIKYGKQKLKHAWEQTNRWTKGSEQSLHVCFESYLWMRSCLVGVPKLQSRRTLFYLRGSCWRACVCTVVPSNPLASVLALACLPFELGTQNGFPCFLCDKMSGLRGDLACSLSDLRQTVMEVVVVSRCFSVCVFHHGMSGLQLREPSAYTDQLLTPNFKCLNGHL